MTVETPESHIFQCYVSKSKPMAVGGKGLLLTFEDPVTKERNTVIDALSGAAVCSVGHGDPEIIAAMKKAADDSIYTYGPYFTNYAAEELGQFICDRSDGAFTSALFTGSGSEANENAMKIMKQYHIENGEPERYKFIGRKQAYHGYTIGALSIGHGSRRPMFKDILLSDDQVPKVSQCYEYRLKKEGETTKEYTDRCIKELEDTIIANDPKKVAGVIFETVGGSTFGTPTPPPGYLDGCKAVCHKYGVLFMLDEVMCGLGRCGTYHAWQQFMTTGGPDIQSVGKTIGSGFVSLAGLLISKKIKDVFDNGSGFIAGAQTYHSHAFNCAVGLAVQKKIARDHLVENIMETGTYMSEQLKAKLKDCKIVGDIRGAGSFWSVELVKDRATKEVIPKEDMIATKVGALALEKGITCMALPGTVDGFEGAHVTVAPAFIMTKEDAEKIATALSETIIELSANY